MALQSGDDATAKRPRLPALDDPEPTQRDAAAPVDHISPLPEVLRLRILAGLPLKSAIRTGALSRGWRGLWERRWQDDLNPSSLHYRLLPVGAGPSPKALLESLERRGGRRLDRLSLVVETGAMSAQRLRRCLDCAARCAVEDLRVEFRLPTSAAKLAFHFPASSATLARLSLRGVAVSGLRCRDPRPFSALEVLRLHSVDIDDRGLARMLALCPCLAVLVLYCCSDLGKINLTAAAAAGLKLRSLTVAGCRRVNAVDVVPVSSLRSFCYSGDFISAFHLPDDASFADLYICFRGVPRSPDALICNKVFSEKFSNTLLRNRSKLTALTVCSNFLYVLSSLPNAIAHAESAKAGGFFPSTTELQLVMLEMKAPDLRNIYVFLKNSHCSNLERLFVQLPTTPSAPLVHWFDYVWVEPPEDRLENLKVVKIMNFNWRHAEVQLVCFLLRKASSLRTMLLVSPNLLPLDAPGIQKADLLLLGEAVANGQIILSESDDAATQPFHSDVFAEFRLSVTNRVMAI